MENTAVFIGHRYLPDEAALAPAVRAAVRRLLAAGYRRFLCGGYGSFDRLCAEIRNRWMVEQSQAALCHVTHDWGGAYQTLAYARRRGLQIYNV